MSDGPQPMGAQPLAGIRVVEFSHMVMGPTSGLILADLGAEVIKVEPLDGDKTRTLLGSGAGYFPMYNRNKKSLGLNLQSAQGRDIARTLACRADVLIENFRSGSMEKFKLGYDDLRKDNPKLIYCSLKGFLQGPYENRVALDEVVQMMSGLAYMTGLPERPMRAGSSVVDITGGMFGVIATLAAIEERHRTGRGQHVVSGLFEAAAFLVGQHMAQQIALGEKPQPMSVRRSAWAVYDLFISKDNKRIFIGVVSDTQWRKLCENFDLGDLGSDPELATNNNRVAQRERIIPQLTDLFRSFDMDELQAKLERCGLPFAPINQPGDLFKDPQMCADDGLIKVTLRDGQNKGKTAGLPALPLSMNGKKMRKRLDLPQRGEHLKEIAAELSITDKKLAQLIEEKVVCLSEKS